jgi:predicted transcriptional regulator
MARQPTIGMAELEILRYIHDHPAATVGDVAEHFAQVRGHVRTTVQNVMQRLCQKGFLARRKLNGVYTYSARQSKGDLLRKLVGDFVETALGGSFSPFVAYLAREAKLTPKDVEDLRRLVRDLEAHPPKKPDAGKEPT